MTTEQATPSEIFAVDLAALAREIACDIFPLEDILSLHRLSDEQWMAIQQNATFSSMLVDMVRDWQSATNTRDRIKIKAQTGLEATLEIYVRDISDPSIPLIQRVEAGKFLARLGEMDGNTPVIGGGGGGVTINIITGSKPGLTLTGTPVLDLEPENTTTRAKQMYVSGGVRS
jgi:hypothetical protein